MTDSPTVRLDGVSRRYGRTLAADSVDLSLHAGRVHALIGANGAGKSTIIKVVGGAVAPTAGRILVDERPVTLATPRQAEEHGIAVVHQETQVFPALTVAENVTAARPPSRGVPGLRFRDRRAADRIAREMLDRLGVTLDPSARVGGLDLAEKKLVQIARALLGEPRLLVLDEPTAALELRQSERIVELIGRLADQGLAVLFVSHKLDEIAAAAAEVTTVREGRVVARLKRGDADLTVERLSELVAGKAITGVTRGAGSGDSSVLVEAQGLGTGGVAPTDAVLRTGEVVTFAGVLGSGAAAFARALARATPAAGGLKVGSTALRRSRAAAAAAGIGFVPEERKRDGILPLLSIEQNIALASIGRLTKAGVLSRRRMREQAERFIRDLDIRPTDPRFPAGQLSGGNQQKVLLARWLAAGARVLVVEEPTHGIDVGAKVHVSTELRRFADANGCVAVVALESEEFAPITDRYLVFRRQRLVADLPAPVDHAEVWSAGLGVTPEGATR